MRARRASEFRACRLIDSCAVIASMMAFINSSFRFDTLRLRLIKFAAVLEVLKRKLHIHLPTSTPNQPIFAPALTRLARMLS